MSAALSRFPCHPDLPVRAGAWASCPECGTCLRVGTGAPPVHLVYDERYPTERGHHDPSVGRCKVRSLERWLGALGIDPAHETICEVGFGGGDCLAALHRRGSRVIGLEPVAANRDRAATLGVPPERLFDVEPLPVVPFDPTLWLFQDSFEHLEDPGTFLTWMTRASCEAGARVLVVAPDARSASHSLLGPLWPHNSADHRIHYTRAGVEALFGREGFRLLRTFRPVKCLSPGMVIRHLGVLRGRPTPAASGALSRWTVWFNIGEMGLLLGRDAHRP